MYRAPVQLLVTWSDRGPEGPPPAHHTARPSSDRGPLLRLLEQEESRGRYDAAWILTTPAGEGPTRTHFANLAPHVPHLTLKTLAVDDPSDYGQLFRALGPLTGDLKQAHPTPLWGIDVVLSAGTPQMQTLWVILVQAGLLPARMLQIIPAAFVPHPHPRAVREVRLDIDGFPEIRALRAEVLRLRAESRTQAGTLLGDSEPMHALRARIARVAATDVPVLIHGETGTGKELVARALHEASARAVGPFVAENCGAFAEGVLASELFGHEAGAFTGAAGRRRGLFEQAHGGTLFLDEVGELEPRVQASLLRVLQEGVIRRVGGERPVPVDVRVLAATHRDLPALVADGRFREDLYYRLRGATIEVPPLRDRLGDVPLLVRTFLDAGRGARKGRRLVPTQEALRALYRYGWPGNVRELRAEVERWFIFCDEGVDVADLAEEIRQPANGSRAPVAGVSEPLADPASPPLLTLAEAVAEAERAAIAAALVVHDNNLARTARTLGIDRNTLKRKLALHGLGPARPPSGG
jgi:two-component system response regulator AtoC